MLLNNFTIIYHYCYFFIIIKNAIKDYFSSLMILANLNLNSDSYTEKHNDKKSEKCFFYFDTKIIQQDLVVAKICLFQGKRHSNRG